MAEAKYSLDAFLKPYETNHNLPEFMNFFGQDRFWVAGVLKQVLPNVPQEALDSAAYELWSYAQTHKLNLDKANQQLQALKLFTKNLGR